MIVITTIILSWVPLPPIRFCVQCNELGPFDYFGYCYTAVQTKIPKTTLINLLISLQVFESVHGFSYCPLQPIFCYILEGSTRGGIGVFFYLCSMRELPGVTSYLLTRRKILSKMMLRSSSGCLVGCPIIFHHFRLRTVLVSFYPSDLYSMPVSSATFPWFPSLSPRIFP